jgi:hypothetical protein
MSAEPFLVESINPEKEEMNIRYIVVAIGMVAIIGCSLVVLFMRSN